MVEILKYYSLKNLNTFGIDALADRFVSIKNIEDVRQLIESDVFQNNKICILGAGSNILFAGDFKGLIISIDIKGIKIVENTDEYVILEAGAGEYWHDFVSICLKNNYFGLENLALIPGKVGAAPVQNIGAYGVEQKEYFYSLEGFDFKTKTIKTLNKDDCSFDYRSSVFKKELKNSFLITSVKYKLNKKENINLSYKELNDEIKKFPMIKPDANYVFNTIIRLRKRKLPDPKEFGNAGSFFKNPVIEKELFESIKKEYPDIKGFEIDNRYIKISAGWLIDKCGWKGKSLGNAGVSDKHALILINLGNATGRDILNLADDITNSVFVAFGIMLEKKVEVMSYKL